MRLALAAIALALWSCPAHAFCEPTEEEIAAARVRIEAREASGMVGMGDDVAMVMDADNIRKRRAAAFRLRLSLFPRIVADEIRRARVDYCREPAVYRRSLSGPRAHDYIIHYADVPGVCGSLGCELTVVLNPRPGKWVEVPSNESFLVHGWRTIRRGGRTLLVTTLTGWMCGGPESPKWPACIVTYRASRGKLVEISRVREK
jgi:hypothetical protein